MTSRRRSFPVNVTASRRRLSLQGALSFGWSRRREPRLLLMPGCCPELSRRPYSVFSSLAVQDLRKPGGLPLTWFRLSFTCCFMVNLCERSLPFLHEQPRPPRRYLAHRICALVQYGNLRWVGLQTLCQYTLKMFWDP